MDVRSPATLDATLLHALPASMCTVCGGRRLAIDLGMDRAGNPAAGRTRDPPWWSHKLRPPEASIAVIVIVVTHTLVLRFLVLVLSIVSYGKELIEFSMINPQDKKQREKSEKGKDRSYMSIPYLQFLNVIIVEKL